MQSPLPAQTPEPDDGFPRKPHFPALRERVVSILGRGHPLTCAQIAERVGRRPAGVSDILRSLSQDGSARRLPGGLWEAAR